MNTPTFPSDKQQPKVKPTKLKGFIDSCRMAPDLLFLNQIKFWTLQNLYLFCKLKIY